MGSLTLFDENSSFPTVRRESRLADTMAKSTGLRRIQTNTNGTFKRIVGGEQIGKSAPHNIDVIIVGALPDVSRQFYIEAYDPNAKPTAPDCWSNLGDTPDAAASKPQGRTCNSCKQNTDGSGNKGKGRACRFVRRVAVLVVGDPSGEVYQMGFAGTSLFGKGVGNVHPFESYVNFLKANGEGVDTVVTRIAYDLEADTMKLKFKAARHLTEEEAALVDQAQDDPETERYFKLSSGAPRISKVEPQEEVAPARKVAAKVEAPKDPFGDDGDDAEAEPVVVAAPVRRTPKKPVEVSAKAEIVDVMDKWLSDEDED
jgi:hypothetical protein